MSDLPFTLDQLRILKAIAAEGSFKRAADSLYVSQPAVSLQVQNLERQLDVPLFDRGGRRAQLTEAGHLLPRLWGQDYHTLSGNLSSDRRSPESSRWYPHRWCFSDDGNLSITSDDWDV
jgi:molybdenum-dependent DNA-binding transcriptional regulator ModE